MVEIVEMFRDASRGDGGVFCRLDDGRVFVALDEQLRPFAEPEDRDALAAANRAWSSNQGLFRGPVTPRRRVVLPSEELGMVTDLSEKDRDRLYRIIRKQHRKWFREPPTVAQMDNLIDGIGTRIVQRRLKEMLDAGDID